MTPDARCIGAEVSLATVAATMRDLNAGALRGIAQFRKLAGRIAEPCVFSRIKIGFIGPDGARNHADFLQAIRVWCTRSRAEVANDADGSREFLGSRQG